MVLNGCLIFLLFFVQNSKIIIISLVTQKTQSSTNGLTCRKVDACLVFFSTPREIQLMTSYNTLEESERETSSSSSSPGSSYCCLAACCPYCCCCCCRPMAWVDRPRLNSATCGHREDIAPDDPKFLQGSKKNAKPITCPKRSHHCCCFCQVWKCLAKSSSMYVVAWKKRGSTVHFHQTIITHSLECIPQRQSN